MESIQRAIYEKLILDEVVMDMVTGVYDTPEQALDSGVDSDYPMITIGEENVIDWDTDTELGFSASITIHVWSRKHGMKEAKDIQQAIYQSLHRSTDLEFIEYSVIDINQDSSTVFPDIDGITQHGVQTFTLTIQED